MKYVPYTKLEGVPNVVVDGAAQQDTVLTLSHWPGSGSPAEFRADTSAEMVLNYLATPGAKKKYAHKIRAVSNNHFDEDGLCAVWAMVHPKLAREHQSLLVDVATAGDFATSVLPLITKFQLTNMVDSAWESVFDVMDFTNVPRNGFEILDVEDGLTFNEVPEGEKAKIYKMAGAKTSVTFAMYGAGLGWHRRLFDDREYWTAENNAVAFRIVNMIGENCCAFAALMGTQQQFDHVVSVEDVVTEHERTEVITDKFPADDERFSQSAWVRLHGILNVHPPFAAVAEQLAEERRMVRGRNHQHIANSAQHQRGERIIDQRFVVDGHQLLGYGLRHRIESSAGTASENDPLAPRGV